jgi:hypothetical protein
VLTIDGIDTVGLPCSQVPAAIRNFGNILRLF